MRAPVRVADLQTRAEAASFLRSAFEHQLDASIESNAQPNVGIAGDSGAKQAFNALLSPTEQRAFFQHIISDSRYWPRIKSLIGNPPYSFLLPEDEGLLRAGGICRNRANLSAQGSHVSKASDFGNGHFYDNADRTYRVINYDQKDLSLPWQNINVHNQLVVDVLLKTYTQKTKVAIFRGTHSVMNNQAALMFPRPGQEVVLHLSKHLENRGPLDITARIDSGRQKSAHSSIARLVVTVLER
tara:strand:+ start:2620 stop:3345 length:726 start_codon:yes stop_codon:yes gene_type:complete